jgi:ADP-heptose:LPS heptosyltransferase
MEKFQNKEVKKILILQYKPFGDVLLNTGYLSSLKEKFENVKIDFLVRKPYDIVLRDNPNLNEVITFKKVSGIKYLIQRIKLILDIRKSKYDLVIDQLKGSGSGIISLFSGAKYRLGFYEHKFNWVYNLKINEGSPKYTAARKFDLLKPIGIDEVSYKVEITITQEAQSYIRNWLTDNNLSNSKIICVAPGSPVASKKWSSENFAILCDRIIKDADYKLVFIGAPDEKNDIKNAIDKMSGKALIAPKTDFIQAGALLQNADLLICNDGGLNHLSIAVETFSLAIFGNTDPILWSGQELGNHFYLKNDDYDFTQDDTFGISPEQAYDKFEEILSLDYFPSKGQLD